MNSSGSWVHWVASRFSSFLAFLVNKGLEGADLFVIYRRGRAIGDVVCMTAVVRELHRSHGFKVVVFTSLPDIFRHNPRVAGLVDFESLPRAISGILLKMLDGLHGSRLQRFLFTSPERLEDYMRRTRSPMHLAQAHAAHFPVPIEFRELRPEIFLTSEETARFEAEYAFLGEYALIHSTGKTSYTPNKEWGSENFQAVVSMRPDIRFVQIGHPGDAPLHGVIDLRGRTPSLRALAYVVSRARFLVCQEGLYNHLAAAFDVPAIVVFSGFSLPALAAYPGSRAVSRSPQVECSPCWLLTPCPIPGRPCMSDVSAAQVVREIDDTIAIPRGR